MRSFNFLAIAAVFMLGEPLDAQERFRGAMKTHFLKQDYAATIPFEEIIID